MNPARALGIVSIVARNAVPIAGIAFFGWSAAQLVLIYYVDTLVAIAFIFTLLFLHAKELREGLTFRARDYVGVAIGIVLVTAAIGFAIGFPVVVIAGTTSDSLSLDNGAFRTGLLLQLLFACVTFLVMSRELRGAPDQLKGVKKRFHFVLLRWVALFASAFFVPWAPALVVVYAGASAWLELHPKAIQ